MLPRSIERIRLIVFAFDLHAPGRLQGLLPRGNAGRVEVTFPCICPTSSLVEPKELRQLRIRAFVRTTNMEVIEFFMDIACT